MSDICPVCGLPVEVCLCETYAKSDSVIEIDVQKRKFGKDVTILTGIDAKIDSDKLVKKLKSKLACGGTNKDNIIVLQGNHRERLISILQKEGFNVN